MVKDVKLGKDGKIREIDITYRNNHQGVNRYTKRHQGCCSNTSC